MENRETRSIVELLQLMLDNKDLIVTGLCELATTLWCKKIYNYEELTIIRDYIIDNKPNYNKWHIYSIINGTRHFYWTPQWKYPRVQWLKKHIIKKTKQNKTK